MKAKEYAHILEKLIEGAESEKDLNEKTEGFLAYVKEKNHTPLLGKIVKELERKWGKDIRNIRVERGGKDEGSEWAEYIRKLFSARGVAARVTEKVVPSLISGVKVTVDDNYRVEASLEDAINQMFNPSAPACGRQACLRRQVEPSA